MKKKLYLLLAWLREYFKHPIENIRTADPIVPNRTYRNFGNICICVPYTSEEIYYLAKWPEYALPLTLVLQASHSGNTLRELDNMYSSLYDHVPKSQVPSKCVLCDFYKSGIPCPLNNHFKDGSTACDTHKYIIIKHQK